MGGYWYPNPPVITSTARIAPSTPTIAFAWAPTPPPPKNWILGGPSPHFLRVWIPLQVLAEETRTSGVRALTSLIFKYWIELFASLKIKAVPGLSFA